MRSCKQSFAPMESLPQNDRTIATTTRNSFARSITAIGFVSCDKFAAYNRRPDRKLPCQQRGCDDLCKFWRSAASHTSEQFEAFPAGSQSSAAADGRNGQGRQSYASVQ